MLEDTENWLYEDGEDQPKHVYEEKLDALKVCRYVFQGNVYIQFRKGSLLSSKSFLKVLKILKWE